LISFLITNFTKQKETEEVRLSESSWMNPAVRPLAGALETTLQASAAAAVFLPHLY